MRLDHIFRLLESYLPSEGARVVNLFFDGERVTVGYIASEDGRLLTRGWLLADFDELIEKLAGQDTERNEDRG